MKKLFWKGKELETIGDVMRLGIDQCLNKTEALEFMKLVREHNPNADANIGYISGYYSAEEAERIMDWFEVSHPIFGRKIASPETALAKGIEIGTKIKNSIDAGYPGDGRN